jgi:hypothetical protein
MTLYCPEHGAITEEQQLLSSGGLYCAVVDADYACCMKPLEEQDQNADNSK